MAVRIVVALVLIGFLTVGVALTWYGATLHFQYADASDPPSRAVSRLLWLGYLCALDLFWGAAALSLAWPGERSTRARRALWLGSSATAISGLVLLASSVARDAGRFYTELAGLVVLSAVVAGFGNAWASRRPPRRRVGSG
jgi:hypothetical protein